MRSISFIPALAALAALTACSSAPPAPPPPPPAAIAPTASAAPSAARDTPTAQTTPAAPAAPNIQILGTVGDVTVASFPPTGFDQLTAEQRVLAYHLTQAALAGDPLYTMQTSRYAKPAEDLTRQLLAQKDKLDPAFRDRLIEFRRRLFLHHGLHDNRTGQKMAPPFAKKELEAAAKALKITIPKDLLAGLFDPKVAPTVVNKTPGKGKDPLVESAATHYEGVTGKDLEKFEEKYPLNGRVVKQKGKIVEEVYRAGGDGAAPGLGAKELGRVVEHLEAAIPLAPKEEQEALKQLVRYFRAGDNAAFDQHDIAWLKQIFPVDYILGFIETYTDARERKGTFEGLVFVADPVRNPPLQALAKEALYFEQKLPWDAKWKRDAFATPAAAAVTTIAATGDGGPFTFLGVNLPNKHELREKYGSKNFVALSTMDSREVLTGSRYIDEFAPAEARAELHRCAPWLEYAATSFHEVTGHGSGKGDPGLKGDPSKILAPYYAAMEEGRAELVADVLSGDPKTVQIGLLPDAGCVKIFPQYQVMMKFLRLRSVPQGDVAEEDHLRADLIALGYLRDKGAVTVEVREGKTFLVVKDAEAWRRGAAELLAEHQRIKSTGDKKALAALVDKYGTKIDTKWRDEVIARIGALKLPRLVATVPPMVSAVKDAAGKIIDAKAEQTTSLDAYIDMVERASRL